jgi:cholinesterase
VDYYSYAWTQDPIVNGLIAESGTALGLPGDPPNSRSWNTISKSIGCGTGASSVECMKKASWQKLLEGVNNVGLIGGASSLLAFWPVWDNKTIFKDIHERQESGKFIKRVSL